MKEIGGYFELELARSAPFHKEAIALCTSRNCLQYILDAKAYTRVLIPRYTCEGVLEPLHNLNLEFEFYPVDRNLEPLFNRDLRKGEVFLYINYFGIKGDTVLRLSNTPNDIIIDNSQAFFSKPIEGIDTFYSARKFFGVSDGAYLYTDKKLKKHFRQDISFDRMLHLLKRIDISANYGYESFKQNEHALSISEIRKMSVLTGKILSSVNYKGIQKIREENFLYVHEKLKDYNELHIDINAVTGPMTYPFLRAGNRELREEMHRQKIYAPTYWPNVFNWCQSSDNEYYLAENIIPIPIDQRITHRDLNKILELILN
jgi:hypothetical protein